MANPNELTRIENEMLSIATRVNELTVSQAVLSAKVEFNMPIIMKGFSDGKKTTEDSENRILAYIEKLRKEFLEKHQSEISMQFNRIDQQDEKINSNTKTILDRLDKTDKRAILHSKFLVFIGLIVLLFFGWSIIHPESATIAASVARNVFVKPQ